MPEGDAVRRTADRLDRALAGQTLQKSDFRVPQLATTDLAGARVGHTATHGKHLLTRIATVDGTRLTLHTHLKMEGSWHVSRTGSRWSRPASEARVVLRTAHQVEAVGFLLGVVELIATAAEGQVIGHLGPDLLGAWTPEHQATAMARLTAAPDRTLGTALLDQTVVAGLGTIWVAESCFLHGVSPLAPVGDLRDPARFLARARQMMQLSMQHGRPVTTGNRRDPLWVYGRTRQPCRRCGTPLVAGNVGDPGRERTTYWCPVCQPMSTTA